VRWNYAHDDTIKKSESKGGGFFKTVMDKIKKSFGWKNNIGKFNQ